MSRRQNTASTSIPSLTPPSLFRLWGNPGEPSGLSYGVILDNNTYTYLNYTPSGSLFGMGDLSSTVQHRVAINPTNLLSSVVIEMDVDANMQLDIDDMDLWNFPPQGTVMATSGEWVSDQCIGSGQFGGTCHTSSTPGDSMSFTFEGEPRSNLMT